jgi:hypothetical protein
MYVQISPRTSKLINTIQELNTLVRIRSKSRHVVYLSTVDDEVAGWDRLPIETLARLNSGWLDGYCPEKRDPT